HPARPAPPGFALAGKRQGSSRLAGADAAARDGDVIEVHGDGPFPTPPVRTAGKRLTIRAGPGSRPVFLPEVPGQLQNAPFVSADADLVLEGLDVRWGLAVRRGRSDADLLSRCV